MSSSSIPRFAGVAATLLAFGIALATTDCTSDDEPCIKGLAAGQRLRVTVVGESLSLQDAGNGTSRACLDALGFAPGTQFTLITTRPFELTEVSCTGFFVNIEGLTKVSVGGEAGISDNGLLDGFYHTIPTDPCSASLAISLTTTAVVPLPLPIRGTPGIPSATTIGIDFRPDLGGSTCPTQICTGNLVVSVELES